MAEANKRGTEIYDDFIGDGFKKVDHLVPNPPKIKWGAKYRSWSVKEKLAWAEKLACAMNHAADLVQQERDALNVLCQQKEDQLHSMKAALDANNRMVATQVTAQNEERQRWNAEAVAMRKQIRELQAQIKVLQSGDHG